MDLVNELQVSAERDDVLTVLRKARRLASKLGVADIDHWLKCESEGYARREDIPAYRIITCSLVLKADRPIPTGWGMVGTGVMELPGWDSLHHSMGEPVSSVMNMIGEMDSKVKVGMVGFGVPSHVEATLRERMNELIADQVTFWLRGNSCQVRAIPDAVKDRVLDWALALEQRGVRGENLTFSDREKAAAQSLTFNLSNCQVGQIAGTGTNLKGGNG